jgi:hypothetical protein
LRWRVEVFVEGLDVSLVLRREEGKRRWELWWLERKRRKP